MARLLHPGQVAEMKGCSKKTIQRACEQGKLNSEYDPVNNEYTVYDDEKLAQWRPGDAGTRPST